jgi:hypothetical protein
VNAVRGVVAAVAVMLLLGRPVGADAPPDDAPLAQTIDTTDVTGTAWEGTDGPRHWRMRLRFEKGGILVYSVNNSTCQDGHWKLDGDKVYFEIYHKCHQCEGVVHGDRFEGDTWTQAGVHWTTVFRLSVAP